MKMRKVLSFVLILALVLGSVSMAFAAPAKQGSDLSDIKDNANYDAIVANADLGIITGYTDGTFGPAKNVNRAEFAAMITRMLNIPESALTGYSKTSFKDMDGYAWANGYVGFCEAKGIITGYGNGTFGPANTITVNEAVTMVLRAIGYVSTSDELVGNWPSNYVTLAKRLALYDDVKATAVVDRASAAQIIYNSLTSVVVTVNADGDTENAFAVYDNKGQLARYKTVLEAYLNCTPTGWIVYTEKNAASSIGNTTDYVGAYVSAFVNKDNDVVAIAEVKSTFLTGKYDDKGNFKAAGVKYTLTDGKTFYDDSNTTAKEKIDAVKFVNGQEKTTIGAIGANATVTIAANVSGKTIKDVYSVNEWTPVDIFKFDKDMLEKDALNGYTFVLDDNDGIDTNKFILAGVDSLDKIAKDNVVSVYLKDNSKSKSGIVKVTVGTKVIEGKVTIEDDGGDYTIGGNVYGVIDGVAPKLGEVGKAWLDFNGDVAFWDVTGSDADNYAIVTGEYKNVGRDSTIVLFDKEGKEKEYVVKDGVTLSATYAGVTELSHLTKDKLVTFSLDKYGKIDKLSAYEAKATNEQLSATRTVIGGDRVDAGVVVFVKDGSDYKVSALANMKTKKDLNPTTIYVDKAGKGKVKVIITTPELTGADSVYAMLNKAQATYNATDDKVQKLNGVADGKAYSALTDDDNTVGATLVLANATTPVIAELSVNSEGVVLKAGNATTGLAPAAKAEGYVIEKSGRDLGISDTTNGAIDKWAAIDNDAVIYVLDSTADSGEWAAVGNWSAIKAKTAVEGSKVFLYQFDDDSEYYDFVVVLK